MEDSGLVEIKGGSGLAHEGTGTSGIHVAWPDAFASKPALTGDWWWMEDSGLVEIKGGSGLAHEGVCTFSINVD